MTTQRIMRATERPCYASGSVKQGLTQGANVKRLSDRNLMNEYVREYLYSHDSSSFVRVCAELGARGYNPNYEQIKKALS